MSGLIHSSMRDARDAEDTRLFEEGEVARLVESYYGVVIERCQARVPAQDALDVAANAVERLLRELKSGRSYTVPFRVVVHMVTTWKIREFYTPARFTEVELDERLASADPMAGLEHDLDFAFDLDRYLDGLPDRAQQVARLRIADDLSPEQIASRLGIDRNAVDQAWHRAKRAIVERLPA
jgi:RNA polymerase sigma factor (sigma-70 family)